jgi:hypothetical protein
MTVDAAPGGAFDAPPDGARAAAVPPGVVPAPHPGIDWPEGYHPAEAPVFVHNHRRIAAPPGVVWAWLVRAPLWPAWYSNSHRVRLLAEDDPTVPGGGLRRGTRFRWRTFGVGILSVVWQCTPQERLGWDGRGVGARVYHAWRLFPDGAGTLVVTEEVQHGWGARLMHWLRPRRMWEGHEQWLEQLERRARGGMPPGPLA